MDKSKSPGERRKLDAIRGLAFPNLGDHYEVEGPSTPRYNCIAHTLGDHGRWVNPQTRSAADPLSEMDRRYAVAIRETPMNIAERFNALADRWQEHADSVWYSSSMKDYLDHPAYRELVALGLPAIPFIVGRYQQDDLPWGFALQEITGVKIIEDPNTFKGC
jgi:hypothetical protein